MSILTSYCFTCGEYAELDEDSKRCKACTDYFEHASGVRHKEGARP